MPVPRRVLAVFPAAFAAAAAIAAPASAATLTVPPCVVDYGGGLTNFAIAGTGFTPGGSVGVESASAAKPSPLFVTGATADAAGNFDAKPSPLSFNSFDTTDQTFGLLATDRTNPAITAAAQVRQVRFGFDANPSTGKPSRKVKYTARGFAPGKPIYAHFRFGGKTIRNIKIGAAAAPCGTASLRMRLLPGRSRFGRWTVYMDQVKNYSPQTVKTGLSAKGTLVISRTFG